MKRTMLALAALFATCLMSPAALAADAAKADAAAKPAVDRPHIDVVFCVDCSGSMGPVIETAKQKVWAIVNEVAKAKPSPVLRIGLLGYGNFDKQFRQFDLSDDLDDVYKHLVTFKDEGWGDEWVGLAVHKATTEMHWAEGKQVLKVIYVVGNETAHQGQPDYTRSAPEAIAKGIIVNAIYCGNVDFATAPPTWKEMAKLADGQYMEIAATGGAVVVATPFDKELAELSGRLNTTYVGYGKDAKEAAANQQAQDANAAKLNAPTAADRAVSKAQRQYDNARWDVVDAVKNRGVKLDELKDEQLPEEMRKLDAAGRQAYVEQKAKERADVQKQITDLAAKRAQYVKDETSKKGLTGDKAFETAVRESVVKQAEKQGFTFEEK